LFEFGTYSYFFLGLFGEPLSLQCNLPCVKREVHEVYTWYSLIAPFYQRGKSQASQLNQQEFNQLYSLRHFSTIGNF